MSTTAPTIAAGPAPATAQERDRLLLCRECDLWWDDGPTDCWMCGRRGAPANDVAPWSAIAPSLFL